MKQVIISTEGCQKCAMLKNMVPDAEFVVANPSEILQFARLVGITSMPFVISVGEPHELETILKKGA